MAKFVLSNNYFEFSEKVFQQIPRVAIGIKFAPPYPCIYMDEVLTEFLNQITFECNRNSVDFLVLNLKVKVGCSPSKKIFYLFQ